MVAIVIAADDAKVDVKFKKTKGKTQIYIYIYIVHFFEPQYM